MRQARKGDKMESGDGIGGIVEIDIRRDGKEKSKGSEKK